MEGSPIPSEFAVPTAGASGESVQGFRSFISKAITSFITALAKSGEYGDYYLVANRHQLTQTTSTQEMIKIKGGLR